MKDLTPIKELIEIYKLRAEEYSDDSRQEAIFYAVIEDLKLLLEKDKAHRDKYKHTEYDIKVAFRRGEANGLAERARRSGLENDEVVKKYPSITPEQYYNETFNK